MGWPSRFDRLPDDALLAAVALGEADAAATFVRRFQRRVYGLAVVVTGDRTLAEDVAQQAFERAWRHAGTYDARRGSVPTWLLTITRNLAIDAVRLRRADPLAPVELGELLDAGAAGGGVAGGGVAGGGVAGGPEQRAVHDDEVRRVRAALDRLPDAQRRAVVLATIGGRTSVEISAIEGVPVPTAKTRLRTGLLRLRDLLAEEAPR